MGPRGCPDLPSFVDFKRIVSNTPPYSGYCGLGSDPIGDEHPCWDVINWYTVCHHINTTLDRQNVAASWMECLHV